MRLAILALATVCVLGATPAAARAQEVGFDGRARYRVEVAGAPALGPADAPVTIVEYSDFLCRYCQKASETLADLRLLYGDRLRVVYRHSLLDPEDGTLLGQAALAAAAQGRFWPMHDRLFALDRQPSRAALDALAGELGLDLARFRRELDDAAHLPALLAEHAAADRLGVSSTPMFFINGRPLSGNQPIGTFVEVIERELVAAARLGAGGVAPAAVYDQLTGGGLIAAGQLADDAVEIVPAPLDEARVYPAGLGLPSQRRGADDALVTIVEFGDFLCGYCGRAEATLAALAARYGAELRIVMRFSPLGGDATGEYLAEAALAAGEQGQLWPLHHRLFATDDHRPDALAALAGLLGLDVARFTRALAERRFRRAVLADAAEGSRFGVRGTPTFFINGRVLVGAQPVENFETQIDAELARARALLATGVPRAELYRRLTGAE